MPVPLVDFFGSILGDACCNWLSADEADGVSDEWKEE